MRLTQRLATLYARVALGTTFLVEVADRFGLLGSAGGWKTFANFTAYTAKVNAFMPTATIPFLAWAATIGETYFGVMLIAGWWPRSTAIGSAALLAIFAGAMSISFGIKSPLDYSVFSASAAAALLAVIAARPDPPSSSEPDRE